MHEPDKGSAGEPESIASTRLWFALRVKSNFERATTAILSGKGYETYLPLYRQQRRWSDRTNVTELPLFPGYVFAHFDVDRRLPVLTTPGVVHIVPPRLAQFGVEEG
ncbi:MAG: transcription termination/antitermination NusG family protein [Spirochaetia bacterium]